MSRETDDIFETIMGEVRRSAKISTGSVLAAILNYANSNGMIATQRGDEVDVDASSDSGSNTRMGFYDLKPAFASSTRVQHTKAGAWYMRVPIRRKVKSMSSSLYKQARQIEMGTTEKLENLLGEREELMSPFGQLPSNLNTLTGEQNRWGNLTRIKGPHKNGSTYIAFRTVSAKSPANSWILKYNMDTEELDDTEKNFDKIINEAD